jgi:hypothetical protein
MNYADRVQETSTTTGAGALTLAGASSFLYRPFNPAIPVGAKVPYGVSDALGNWEIGYGTLTAATTLSRDTVLANSLGTLALINFPAGTKSVILTVPADAIARGMVNKDDAGFDVVLCAGQSNMVGYGNTASAAIDCADSGVYQFGSYAGDSATYQQIVSGADPLKNSDGSAGLGPATAFAKAYASTIPTNRRVLLVPICIGGTTMVAGTPRWNAGSPGGDLYESAISQSNAAIAKAILHYPNSRFVGLIWLQGESDGDSSVSQATYATAFKAALAGFRSRITGASGSFAVIAGMLPEGISGHAGYPAINLAHQQVASEVSKCTFVAGPSGFSQDGLHYTAPGQRILGARLGLAAYAASIYNAVDTTAPTVASAAVANASPTVVAITMSEILDGAFVPAASAFTVGGHTVSAAEISGNIINLTVSGAFVNGEAARTVAYTQPGANNTRDLAGNLLATFSGQAIANNVAAVDTTAPSFSSAQVANASPTVIQVTMNEALAAVAPIAGAFTVSGGKTVSSVSITGAVISLTCSAAYVYGDTITVTYTKPGSGNMLQDAAGNLTATFGPSSVTNNVAAVASYPRLSNLTRMTESGTGPYTYVAVGAGSYGGGEGDGYLQLNAGDGELVTQLMEAPLGNDELLIGLDPSSATMAYNSLDYAVVSHPGGYAAFASGSGYGSASGVVGANGDYFKAKRVGTTITFEVSKDSGATYTTVFTWTGVPTGVLYFHCMPTGTFTFKLVSSVGTP